MPVDKKIKDLAKIIRDARREARLSQAALAKEIGVTDKAISAYETSRSTPTLDKLKKIAKSTNQPLTYFLEGKVDNSVILIKLEKIEKEFIEVRKLILESQK